MYSQFDKANQALFSSKNEPEPGKKSINSKIIKFIKMAKVVFNNLEQLAIDSENADKFRKIVRIAGSTEQAKILIFQEKLDSIFSTLGFVEFHSPETLQQLKEPIVLIYKEALESDDPEPPIRRFETALTTLINDSLSPTTPSKRY